MRRLGGETRRPSLEPAPAVPVAVVLARVARVAATVARAVAFQVPYRPRPPNEAVADGEATPATAREISPVLAVVIATAGTIATPAASPWPGDVVAHLIRAGPPGLTVMVQATVPLLTVRRTAAAKTVGGEGEVAAPIVASETARAIANRLHRPNRREPAPARAGSARAPGARILQTPHPPVPEGERAAFNRRLLPFLEQLLPDVEQPPETEMQFRVVAEA